MHKLKSKYAIQDKKTRLYKASLPIIGITGGIATGKTTAGKILRELGFFVIDADKLVKEIYSDEQTVEFIQTIAPDTVSNLRTINFPKLREAFFSDQRIKTKVEDFIYQNLPSKFIKKVIEAQENGHEFLFYEIPLLFEKNLQNQLDLSVCIYASQETQIQRLSSRDQNSPELIDKILKSQINIETKKELADMVINNCHDQNELHSNIQNFIKTITK